MLGVLASSSEWQLALLFVGPMPMEVLGFGKPVPMSKDLSEVVGQRDSALVGLSLVDRELILGQTHGELLPHALRLRARPVSH